MVVTVQPPQRHGGPKLPMTSWISVRAAASLGWHVMFGFRLLGKETLPCFHMVGKGPSHYISAAIDRTTHLDIPAPRIIFFTFKRRGGLYFWSMVAATVGVLVNASAFIINDLGLSRYQLVPAVLIIVGWILMTTGQAFVLYSRLRLLYVNPCVLRPVFYMIVANAVLGPPADGRRAHRRQLPRARPHLREAGRLRNIILHLVAVNLLIVVLDIAILGLEYSGMYLLQTSYKAFVYSVRLKIEISILNRLVDFVRATRRVEFHDRAAKDLEREWTDTLQRTFAANQSVVAAAPGGAQAAVPSLPKAVHVPAAGPAQEYLQGEEAVTPFQAG
ncbi:hypothetical protein GGTG_11953 [Gaeumannomyces tritici R3-111a-1]|uniref:DUF7703 domain-containing protein n=1 Tax=Gaeumannomyces tritici (strain R3-111a-1) TaxID=644352 RepID=J3PEM2_GAET3|nr:hypothetical protein GGTG_11953 [Gaeumannomyces tritici R3-111a-1]EJT70930.1 hypothetical protein GGTG_11953 [Gaeumannomyces tritici R3-111a-1]